MSAGETVLIPMNLGIFWYFLFVSCKW